MEQILTLIAAATLSACAASPAPTSPKAASSVPAGVGLHDAKKSVVNVDVSNGDTVTICVQGAC